jgi:predicted O-methyltransferase YrrM
LLRALDLAAPPRGRWKPGNDWFETADAAVLRALLLHLEPRRAFEIGSGYSTALMLDLDDASLQITCIEPNPERLLALLRPGDEEQLRILPQPVQAFAPEELAGMVKSGDLLLIDSTHVAKAGSDVLWLILHTLPLLQPGVLVHFHDIFWPFEYPDLWLEQRRDWTESYLLQAFLIDNAAWEITLFNSYLWSECPDAIPAELRDDDPGSIWLTKRT